MKKYFILSVILLFFIIPVFSQSNIGIIAGGGVFDINIKTDDKEINKDAKNEFKMRLGYHAGFNFENVIIKRQLYLQLGLHGRSAGFSSHNDSSGMVLHTIHIPLEIKYKYFFDRRGESFIFASGGPYVSANYRGFVYDIKEKERFLNDNSGNVLMNNPKVKFGKDKNADIETFDFGINVSLGYGYSNFQIGYNFGLGLKNAYPREKLISEDGEKNIDFKIKNIYHTLTVGYYFTNK